MREENILRRFLHKMKKEQLILALLFGVLLVIIAIPTPKDKGKEEGSESLFSLEPEEETKEPGYDELEEKLADALAQVEGVGQVRVVLTYDNKEERILPSVQGVLVIAQGGNNPVVIENIKGAVLALFPVEAHKIKVMKMK